MMMLTKRTEYALIALKYIGDRGELGGEAPPVSAREIAQRYGVPMPLLMNILKQLAAGQVLRSTRGAKGGYILSQDLRKLTLFHLVQLLEGSSPLVDCACEIPLCSLPESHGRCQAPQPAAVECRLEELCPIREALQVLHRRLARFLELISVYDICHFQVPDPRVSLEGPLAKIRTA